MARRFQLASSEWIGFGNPTALNPAFPMTVAVILRVASFPGANAKVLSRGLSTGLAGWSLGYDFNKKMLFTKYGAVDVLATTSLLTIGRRTLCGAVVTATNVRFFVQADPLYVLAFENVANATAFAAGTPNNMLMGAEDINSGGGKQRFVDGEILVGAVWKLALSDAQVGNLLFGGLPAWYEPGNPAALWQLEQATTTQNVVDELGVANQSAINGTAVPNIIAYPEWSAPGPATAVY